jgi:hypothetical protein
MPIKCGHCTKYHETVAEVKECSGSHSTSTLSAKQVKYLSDLLDHFGIELINGTPDTVSFQTGQPIISKLVEARRNQATGQPFELPNSTRHLAHPNRGKPRERRPTFAPLPDVPAGYYAIPSRTGNNDYEFYRVDRPTTGEWAGRIYVKTVIGGHPEYNVRGLKNIRGVLEAIVEFGIDKAGILYGQEIEKCRHCNKDLTKYASRILSAGRHCYDIHGGDVGDWDALQEYAKDEEKRKNKQASRVAS